MAISEEERAVTHEKYSKLPSHEYGIMYKVEDSLWWYVGMRHHLQAMLARYWNWQAIPAPAVLDAGCGTGAILQRLLNGFDGQLNTKNAVGIDISQDALEFCRQRGLIGRVSYGSITAIPFPSQNFDIVVSFDVLSYLEDARPGFREVSRVLKHGGLAVINLPAYQSLYSEHDVAVHTVRRYNKAEVADLLAQAGMRVERSTYVNTLLFPPAATVRWLKRRQLNRQTELKDSKPPVHSDLTPPPALINRLLTEIMSVEARFLQKTNYNLPFGLSVLTLARKM